MNRFILVLSLLSCCCLIQAQDVVLNGTMSSAAVVTIDGKHQVLRVGKRSSEGVLLLEVDNSTAVFEINGERVELEIDKHYVANKNATEPKTLVRIPSSAGGHYRAPGRINGQAVTFMVDTGATVIAMNLQTAKQLGLNYRAGRETSIATANGHTTAYLLNLNRVSVGNLELNNVTAAVNIGNFPDEILLGNSYLSRVNMRRENGVLVLEAKY